MLKPTILTCFDIPEVWYRSLSELYHAHSGGDNREYLVQHGSFENQHKRKELDYFMAVIINPGNRPLTPIIPDGLSVAPPTDMDKIEKYFAGYIIGAEVADNEDYTYGERISISLQNVIEILKITPDTNQAIIEVGQPLDIYLNDPPCLRMIDCRIKDGMLHFIIYFRSWDIFAALPENLGGLQLLKEYMAAEIGVRDGGMIISSKGAHVYDYAWDQVKQLVRFRDKTDPIIIDNPDEGDIE